MSGQSGTGAACESAGGMKCIVDAVPLLRVHSDDNLLVAQGGVMKGIREAHVIVDADVAGRDSREQPLTVKVDVLDSLPQSNK